MKAQKPEKVIPCCPFCTKPLDEGFTSPPLEYVANEVKARVDFKLEELLGAMKQAAARNWHFAMQESSQKYEHYWRAFEDMVKMLEKEREMPPPYDEMALRLKRDARDEAVENLNKIIHPLIRGRNDRSETSITRAVVAIVEKAQRRYS